MRLLLLSILVLVPSISAVEFINPGDFVATTDFSKNIIYTKGSILKIRWTPTPEIERTSLTLWQLNGTQFLFPLEYLTQDVLNVTHLDWPVQTNKDLKISNMFYLSLFIVGQTSPVGQSEYFNITGGETSDSSLKSSTLSTSTTSQTASQTSTVPSQTLPNTSPTNSTNPAAAITTPPAVKPTSDGISVGAKAGIGIGVFAALAVGISAGWFIFGRRKKEVVAKYSAAPLHNEGDTAYPYAGNDGAHVNTLHELPSSQEPFETR